MRAVSSRDCRSSSLTFCSSTRSDRYSVASALIPNVIARKCNAHAAAEGEFPQIRTIVYRDLNPTSNGNATGVGHAEFVRSRLLRKTDARVTRLNSLAVGMPALAAAPIDFETDREILDAALTLTGLPEK